MVCVCKFDYVIDCILPMSVGFSCLINYKDGVRQDEEK